MEWFNILNKGIPFDKGMGFTLDVIGDNCSIDNQKYIAAVSSELKDLNDRLFNEADVRFNVRKGLFSVTMDSDLTQHLTFSPQIYILSMLANLDTKYPITTQESLIDNVLIEKARKRLREFKNVKYTAQLEKEFPSMYEEYKRLEDQYNAMLDMRKRYSVVKKINPQQAEEFKPVYEHNMASYKNMFSKYGITNGNVNVRSFVDFMYKVYMNALKPEQFNKATSVISSSAIDMSKFNDCLDKEKFELLVAVTSLGNAMAFREDAIGNISYLTQYFREHQDDIDSDISVGVFFNGENRTINRKELYTMYKDFLINNPDVLIVRKNFDDFKGQTIDDVKAYLEQFKEDLEANWDIIPDGESLYSRPRTNGNTLTEEEKQEKLRNKERIYEEKKKFFTENKPYLFIKGKKTFYGYVGHIYPNALVVLEKFYKNKKGTTLAEDAIYVMKVEEFIDYSQKSKPELIENHLCHKVTHHRGWQGRLLDILKESVSENTIERVQLFKHEIKQLNLKNN